MLGTAALLAGCHSNNDNSGYGIVWVTVTDDPGDFVSYITSIASLTMTRNDGQVFTAIATEEPVDFATLGNTSELWASASIPNGTYTSATITLDYTNASATILNGGTPTAATLVAPGGAALTTVSVTVTFDPANQPVIVPTYASTSAIRLAIDFNVAASNSVSLVAPPPTVTVNPFVTIGVAPADTKPIRARTLDQLQRRPRYLHGVRAAVPRRGQRLGHIDHLQQCEHGLHHRWCQLYGRRGLEPADPGAGGHDHDGGLYDFRTHAHADGHRG